MTQQDKDLLLRDLSARLPYNLYIRVEEFNVPKNEAITEGFAGNYLKDNRCNDYDADDILNELADDCINVKPYLRSISSLTQEERDKFCDIGGVISHRPDGKLYLVAYSPEVLDYLNSIHADYRGMIEKELAIKVTEDNNPYK